MIKKIKKLYYTIMYYYYDWASTRAAKKYWKSLDKERKEN